MKRPRKHPNGPRLLFAALASFGFSIGAAFAQTCPAPLDQATRLVLVTAETMTSQNARVHTFQRSAPDRPWVSVGPGDTAVIGTAGMGWSRFFQQWARPGEPTKVDGDRRSPAGIYPVGRSFGTLPSNRSGYLHVRSDTVCVDDVRSPAYNTITTRDRIARGVSVENMSRIQPQYRRGIVVDYPTDAQARAGSCIFIHVWRNPSTGTAGCVALPQARVEALQSFVEAGAAIAILPRSALAQLKGCIPEIPPQRTSQPAR